MERQSTKKSKSKSPSNDGDDKTTFSCSCGKLYKSKPAVYTHIKIKHNDDRKAYKIIDNSRQGNPQSSKAFRLEFIKFNELQSSLMTLADMAYVNIVKILRKTNRNHEDIILDDFDCSDFQDEDQQKVIDVLQNKEIKSFIKSNHLQSIIDRVKDVYSKELSTFTVHKIPLNIFTEISKFFKPIYKWKIIMEILLLYAAQLEFDRLQQCSSLWTQDKAIQKQIQNYWATWRNLRKM